MTSGWERHANARGKAKRDKCKWIPLSLRVFAAGNLTNDVAIPRLTCLELLVHLFRICRDNWETVFGKVGFPAGPWQATGLRCSSLSIVRGRQFLKPLVLCVCVCTTTPSNQAFLLHFRTDIHSSTILEKSDRWSSWCFVSCVVALKWLEPSQWHADELTVGIRQVFCKPNIKNPDSLRFMKQQNQYLVGGFNHVETY